MADGVDNSNFHSVTSSMKVGELPFNLHRRSCPWGHAASSPGDPNSNTSPPHRPSPLTALLFETNAAASAESSGECGGQEANTPMPVYPQPRCTCPCSDSVKLTRDPICGMDMDLARWLTKCADFGRGHSSLANINTHDRQLLVCSAWKDMVILYMAQNKFDFNVVYAAIHEYIRHIPMPQNSCVQTYPSHHTVGTQSQGDLTGRLGVLPTPHIHPLRRGSDFGVPTMRTVEQLKFTLSKLTQMQLDSKEYAVLRILLLLNSDLHALTDSRAVEEASEKVHTALMEYESIRYPEDPLRLSHMLLLLPGVRGFSAAVFENLFYHHLIGDTSVASVLRELMAQ